MKKVLSKLFYVAMALAIILFIAMGSVSFSSIALLQGNARVVNYVGIVRGATQKLVKEELMGYADDALIGRLDGIVDELLTGDGSNNLVVLQDSAYLDNMRKVQTSWNALKEDIYNVRVGLDNQELFDASQEYFDLVNETVFYAEAYSESQVEHINQFMIGINIAFAALIIIGVAIAFKNTAIRRRADALDKIAYIDTLTKIENRAGCERCIRHMTDSMTEQDVLVFMFDMNDLKFTNDFLGHIGGDKIIAAFAAILAQAASPYGFVGRYGGDEFLAIFASDDESISKAFLDEIERAVNAYNESCSNKLEQISYAAGYTKGNLGEIDLSEVINEADRQMYQNKRNFKEKLSR